MFEAGYGYGSAYGAQVDVAGTVAELISFLLILASFLVITYLAAKVKNVRTFQFEMFLFMLVLVAAEVPRTLYSMGVVDLDWMGSTGLIVHSVSMVVLSAFVAYRTYGFFKGGQNGK